MQAIAIIGANYGDEGKGMLTHRLTAATASKWTVRFNGGPQAGHTVHLKNGKRHVFSSFGAGALAGAQTYLADTVLVDPSAAAKEMYALYKLGYKPRLVLHPKCEVITPWDIALNQFMERGAGPKRNGSCGMGVGEAMGRKLSGLSVKADLLDPFDASFILTRNLQAWFKDQVVQRTKDGAFECLTLEEQSALKTVLENPVLLASKFFTQISNMTLFERADFDTVTHHLRENEDAKIILEGAQGLLLDQDDSEHQPHVTWSKTGVENAVKFCTDFDVHLWSKHYCTRPYLTRHGAGPILAGLSTKNVWGKDLTNVENEYQGELRYAHLDWAMLGERVKKDAAKHTSSTTWLEVSCFDQIGDDYEMYVNGTPTTIPFEELTTSLLSSQVEKVTGLPAVVVGQVKN